MINAISYAYLALKLSMGMTPSTLKTHSSFPLIHDVNTETFEKKYLCTHSVVQMISATSFASKLIIQERFCHFIIFFLIPHKHFISANSRTLPLCFPADTGCRVCQTPQLTAEGSV